MRFGSEATSFFATMNPLLNPRLVGVAISLATALSVWSQSPGPWRRVANTTLRMPASIADETTALLPPTLADTGVFSDLVTLTPHADIVPYDLNVPFWSDGAHKTRWFSLPDTNLVVGFEREVPWSFPAGTVWIKHFELQLTNGVANSALHYPAVQRPFLVALQRRQSHLSSPCVGTVYCFAVVTQGLVP